MELLKKIQGNRKGRKESQPSFPSSPLANKNNCAAMPFLQQPPLNVAWCLLLVIIVKQKDPTNVQHLSKHLEKHSSAGLNWMDEVGLLLDVE